MNDCIFCKIINGDIPSQKVYEDDRVFAFRDITPQAPVHVLIIPKKHIASVNDAADEDFGLFADIHRAAQIIAREEGIADTGYRLINNCGPDSGQEVFHIHYHLLGGKRLGHLVPNS
jgi:histidine triad (HIT) family protein